MESFSPLKIEDDWFVDYVDLPEGIHLPFPPDDILPMNLLLEMEPLLMQTKKRFVLYPIQYPDVP
jgi:hypothetical protein